MSMGGKAADMLRALRASADGALKRLAPGAAPSAPPPQDVASFRDPTVAHFPADSSAMDSGASASGYSLAVRLDDSAREIDQRINLIYQKASDLAETSAARAGGEKSLTIWGWRFMIGMGWLLIAYMLDQAGLNARANGAVITSFGVPLDDVAPLARIFVYIGFVAAGVAALMAASVFLAGNATNDKLRGEARRFGDALAFEARKLADKVDGHREAIRRAGKHALGEVSQAHLTALEAAHFFRSVSFLTTANPEAAEERFSPFFGGMRQRAPGFSFTDLILVGTFSMMSGLAAGKKIYGGGAGVTVDSSALAIMQYPDMAKAIFFGGFAYLVIGVAVDLVANRIGKGVMAKARDEALDAVRSAYLGQGAPLADEMTRQVGDFVQILQAQLGAAAVNQGSALSSAQTGVPGAARRGLAGDADEPEWRRRDSSVKLVETRFAGAPEPWRTDAYAKKLSAEKAPETAAKRGVENLKKPPRD